MYNGHPFCCSSEGSVGKTKDFKWRDSVVLSYFLIKLRGINISDIHVKFSSFLVIKILYQKTNPLQWGLQGHTAYPGLQSRRDQNTKQNVSKGTHITGHSYKNNKAKHQTTKRLPTTHRTNKDYMGDVQRVSCEGLNFLQNSPLDPTYSCRFFV